MPSQKGIENKKACNIVYFEWMKYKIIPYLLDFQNGWTIGDYRSFFLAILILLVLLVLFVPLIVLITILKI